MPMETVEPPLDAGGNTGGLNTGHIISIVVGVPGFLSLIITISTIVWKCRQAKKKKNDPRSENGENHQSPDHSLVLIPSSEDANGSTVLDRSPLNHDRSGLSEGCRISADVENDQSPNHPAAMTETSEGAAEAEANFSGRSPNPAEIPETSEEANRSAGGDQSSQRHQADSTGLSEGGVDRQALAAENRVEDMATSDQTFYDIYLVSTSNQTPQVDKMKDMCKRNGWKFTTPFGKLGVLPMESVQEAVLTCSHVVLVITEDDCSAKKKNLKNRMTIEMAFESVENGELKSKIVPIRCCDEDSLPLMLRSLVGLHIDDDALEKRMIDTVDKEIRREREAQCQSVSDAPADVAGGSDSASAAFLSTM